NPIITNNAHQKPEDFTEFINQIAIQGSAIPPALWAINAELLLNEHIAPGGDVTHPLYEALGWHFSRFSYSANEKSKEFGIGIKDYRGDVWQVILPEATGKGYRYRAPKGIGNKAFFPAMDEETIVKICSRYGIDRARIGEWDDPHQVFRQAGLPLHPAEGVKKCLAILGQGYLSCAVYGQNCLKSPDLAGWAEIRIAIDQDTGYTSKGESKARNNRRARIAGWYQWKDSAIVTSIEWDPLDGKGADDLLVNSPDRFNEAFENPKPVIRSMNGLSRSDIRVKQRYLDLNFDALAGQALGIRSPKGTGKSQLIAQWIAPKLAEGQKILGITHRVSLGQACGDRWGLPWIAEDRGLGQGMICIHSLHSQCKARFNPESWHGAIVLIDEISQVLRDAVNSPLVDQYRSEILSNVKEVCQNASKLVILDADIDDDCIRLLQAWGIDTTTIENEFKPEPFPIQSFDKPESLLSDLLTTIATGGKVLALCDSQTNKLKGKGKAGGKFSTQAVERRILKECPGATVLRVDSETLADKNHPAFQCLRYEAGVLRLARLCLEYDVIIASPSINTGIDLSGIAGHFAAVYGFFNAGTLSPSDLSQFLGRLRDDRCPRKICAKSGFNRNLSVGNGAFSPRSLIEGCKSTLRASLEVLSFAQEQTTIDASWLDYWARVGASSNQSAIDYRQSCYQWLIKEGHKILDNLEPTGDDGQAEIALEIAEERAQEVREAEEITPSVAESLDRKESLTKAERASLEKFKLHSRYGQEVNEELQILDTTTGYASLRLGWFLSNAEQAKSADLKLAEDIGDRAWLPTTAKRSVWGKVKALQALALPRLLQADEFTAVDLENIFQKALDCRQQIKNILGIGLNAKSRVIPFIRELGKRIGRKLIKVRASNGQRFYKFAPLDTLMAKIYKFWDTKADEKTVSELDTKQCISGNKILTKPSNALPDRPNALIPIISGAWAGLKGILEGNPFQGLAGEWRQILYIEGMGSKSIPLSAIGGAVA
ncbi:MAG: plasmid replication protein, CyRepA1 family, partial [Prochlorotrichaceae cyanobacterium]